MGGRGGGGQVGGSQFGPQALHWQDLCRGPHIATY